MSACIHSQIICTQGLCVCIGDVFTYTYVCGYSNECMRCMRVHIFVRYLFLEEKCISHTLYSISAAVLVGANMGGPKIFSLCMYEIVNFEIYFLIAIGYCEIASLEGEGK